MATIKRFNDVFQKHSSDSQLVLLNLPHPPKTKEKLMSPYMAYIDALTVNIPRVLFVSGSDKEVITISS